jgi:hypothetical protein
LVSEIQAATINAGARAEGGLTPDFLALSRSVGHGNISTISPSRLVTYLPKLRYFPGSLQRKPSAPFRNILARFTADQFFADISSQRPIPARIDVLQRTLPIAKPKFDISAL